MYLDYSVSDVSGLYREAVSPALEAVGPGGGAAWNSEEEACETHARHRHSLRRAGLTSCDRRGAPRAEEWRSAGARAGRWRLLARHYGAGGRSPRNAYGALHTGVGPGWRAVTAYQMLHRSTEMNYGIVLLAAVGAYLLFGPGAPSGRRLLAAGKLRRNHCPRRPAGPGGLCPTPPRLAPAPLDDGICGGRRGVGLLLYAR